MNCKEIFANLNAHIVKGLMLHAELADYFDFLNLHGYKRLHEYRFLNESANMRGLHRYYINHFGALIPNKEVNDPKAIPTNWYNYLRDDVSPSEKREFIKRAFESWIEWESETKDLYQQAYTELCDIGEIAAACKIKEMLSEVDNELKKACRMKLSLEMVNYDLSTIFLCQDELHESYKEKEKGIGVDIC